MRNRKPRKGSKKKFFGITFTWTGECWANDYIPFIKFRHKSE